MAQRGRKLKQREYFKELKDNVILSKLSRVAPNHLKDLGAARERSNFSSFFFLFIFFPFLFMNKSQKNTTFTYFLLTLTNKSKKISLFLQLQEILWHQHQKTSFEKCESFKIEEEDQETQQRWKDISKGKMQEEESGCKAYAWSSLFFQGTTQVQGPPIDQKRI